MAIYKLFGILALAVVTSVVHAKGDAITVYKDPNCGCCEAWITHLRDAGFKVKPVNDSDMAAVKRRLGVPGELASCHTGLVEASGQVIEGHVPATVVEKLIAQSKVRGVAAPGMPANAPGMGKLDGNLVTVDFTGKQFSKD